MMSSEEWERKMEFLVNQQAKFDIDMSRLEAAQEVTGKKLDRVAEMLSGYANILYENNKLTNVEMQELRDSQKLTDKKLQALAESQQLTDEQIHGLTKAQMLTDAQIHELREAQVLTDEQIHKLQQAQMLTGEEIHELREAQMLTDEQLRKFIAKVDRLTGEGHNGKLN